MSALRKPMLTVEEYFRLEEAAKTKSEYYRGEMFAMAGASYHHCKITFNIAFRMRLALQGKPCQPLLSELRVEVTSKGLYTYPDVVVVCGDPEFSQKNQQTIVNPSVIVEVLSETTEKYDRGEKFQSYQLIESLKEYVLIGQSGAVAEVFTRQADGTWSYRSFIGLETELEFNSLQIKIPLREVYEGFEGAAV
jgi:Uma2 family endonuclease